MKDEDVKIGMKVVPHDKTATGWGDLFGSSHWKAARENGQPFLFVLRETTNAYDDTSIWVLSEEQDGNGDLFNASDFEPYVKPRRKELRAEITRLTAENKAAQKQISALEDDIAALQDTIKTQARQLAVITIARDHYKDNCHEWSVKYDKDIAAKDAEIAELGRRIRDLLKKQDASKEPELLPVGTRVMPTGTIIGVDNKADTTGNFPYNVYLDGGQDRWFTKSAVKPINHA